MPTNTKTLRRVVVAVATCLLLLQVGACIFGIPAAIRGPSYFRGLYTAGGMVRAGNAHALYSSGAGTPRDGALLDRPAYEAILFVPFSMLPYRAAYLAFFFVNLLLLTAATCLLLPYCENLSAVWGWFPAAVFFCFFPVALSLIQGQDSILLLALLIASAVFFYRRQEFRSGIFLGLAIFNITLTLPIAVLFLLWRRWRIVIGFATTSAAAGLISLWIAGPAQVLMPMRAALAGFSANSTITAPSGRFSGALPSLRCLFEAFSRPYLPPNSLLIVTLVCSIAMIIWAGTRHPNFALAILVTLLASPHGPIQDAVLLLLPIGLVLDARITPISTTHWWSRTVAGALFVGPPLLFLLGWSYCVLSLLMLAMVVTLRSTSTGYLHD